MEVKNFFTFPLRLTSTKSCIIYIGRGGEMRIAFAVSWFLCLLDNVSLVIQVTSSVFFAFKTFLRFFRENSRPYDLGLGEIQLSSFPNDAQSSFSHSKWPILMANFLRKNERQLFSITRECFRCDMKRISTIFASTTEIWRFFPEIFTFRVIKTSPLNKSSPFFIPVAQN